MSEPELCYCAGGNKLDRSKSETSLAAAREMRIDNRMMLNEGACQYIVRELTDLVKGEGRHGG